jgi:hypothetical protein
MQGFRLMGIYVVIVVAALGCSIAAIAILRTAAATEAWAFAQTAQVRANTASERCESG